MSDPKLQAELAERVLTRRRFLPFVKRMNPKYDAGWVHEDICERLERFSQAVVDKQSPRLLLLMPPRHGKSELASRSFPAWHLGRNLDHEFIACSYNLDLARSFSRKVQQIIDSPKYQSVFPAAKLQDDNRSIENWALAGTDGAYVAAGIGGPITGKGAHVLVIDDPIKNAEEADSADTREKIYQWYLSTAYSRLSPGGGLLLIQTAWHDSDLAGRLMTAMREAEDEFVDQFEIVKYPAIAETDEWRDRVTHEIVRGEQIDTSHLEFLRAKGEALHPARYDLNKLLKIKANNRGGRFWAALYQQNPVPDEGEYFTKGMFRRAATPAKQRCNVYIAWDFAISEEKQNDWTVGTVGLQDTGDMLHIADMVRFRSNDTLFIVEAVISLLVRWQSPNLKLGFEDGQIWRAISTILYKRLREKGLYPAITILSPIRDKLARARPLQGRMQQGMISFSDTGEWYDVARSEFLRFPAGANDDTVDSTGWVAQMCLNTEPPAKPAEKRTESWRDRLPSDRVQGLTHMSA